VVCGFVLVSGFAFGDDFVCKSSWVEWISGKSLS